jgi:hypothetical protein
MKFLLEIGTVKFVEVVFSASAIGAAFVRLLSVSCNMRRLLNYSFTRLVLARCLGYKHPLRIIFAGSLLLLWTQIHSVTLVAAVEVEWA